MAIESYFDFREKNLVIFNGYCLFTRMLAKWFFEMLYKPIWLRDSQNMSAKTALRFLPFGGIQVSFFHENQNVIGVCIFKQCIYI